MSWIPTSSPLTPLSALGFTEFMRRQTKPDTGWWGSWPGDRDFISLDFQLSSKFSIWPQQIPHSQAPFVLLDAGNNTFFFPFTFLKMNNNGCTLPGVWQDVGLWSHLLLHMHKNCLETCATAQKRMLAHFLSHLQLVTGLCVFDFC